MKTVLVLSKKRVREAREAIGESREAVARRIDVSTSTIWNSEKGETTPSAEVIARLAALYGVAMESLFVIHEPDGDSTAAVNGEPTDHEPDTAASTRSTGLAHHGG